MNPAYGNDHGDPGFAARAQYFPLAFGMMPPPAFNPYAYTYPYPPFGGGGNQNTYPWMPNGANVAQPRMAGPAPALDPDMPANQMNNSTGGTGCEPGYNYFFPPLHTKMHVLKCKDRPWQMPHSSEISFHACHVPVTTTCADILKGFGATNPVPKLNQCFEVVQGGNGRWYKGLGFAGNEKDMMKMQIQELGWDTTRSGLPGEKPVVCIWVTKGG